MKKVLKELTFEQLFRAEGHTMMEADNVHSALEHYFIAPMYSPSGIGDVRVVLRVQRPVVFIKKKRGGGSPWRALENT